MEGVKVVVEVLCHERYVCALCVDGDVVCVACFFDVWWWLWKLCHVEVEQGWGKDPSLDNPYVYFAAV